MRKFVAGSLLLLSPAALAQMPPVPERLVYELTHSILEDLRPQALTHYRRGADGQYRWHQPTPQDTPTVRLLLQDRLDHKWWHGLMCSSSAADSAQNEPQLLQYFTAADVAYMQRQLPAATKFRYRQTMLPQPWVHVVPADTIEALHQRLDRRSRIGVGDSLLQRFGERNVHHISRMVFTQDQRRALVVVGDMYNGYTLSSYRNTSSGWRREKDIVMAAY